MIDIIKDDVKKLTIDFSSLKNKSILITGASGLIGIYFLSSIKRFKDECNIKIYTWSKSEHKIFEDLFEGCNKIISDITNSEIYTNLPQFDIIIHSSGYGQPGKFLSDKIKTIEVNTSVTKLLLDKLKEDGTFLFISSSEVYNGLYELQLKESQIGTTSPNHPRSPYIEGKRCGEAICNIYKEMGRNVKIVRLSITYGPGTQIGDTRVINSLINKGLTDNSIKLVDDGSSVRTLCYIIDAIEMFWNIILYGKDTLYNVGGIQMVSILDLANQIGNIIGKPVESQNKSNELVGNPQSVNLSIQKYIDEFGDKKFTSLYDGLQNTIKWQIYLNEKN